MNFINCLKNEWLATKKIVILWVCILAGLLIPLIFLFFFLTDNYSINNYNEQTCSYKIDIWQTYFIKIWQNMAYVVLPISIIILSTLVPKTTKSILPQSHIQIFVGKFLIFLLMIFAVFIFFSIGLILAGIIPIMLFDKYFPKQNFPVIHFFINNLQFFICCLPLVAVQFILRLNFKSFLIPWGVGLFGFIVSMVYMKSNYILISPFISCPLPLKQSFTPFNIYGYAFSYFLLLMTIGYKFYVRKRKTDS